jgi:hypothetical protein
MERCEFYAVIEEIEFYDIDRKRDSGCAFFVANTGKAGVMLSR